MDDIADTQFIQKENHIPKDEQASITKAKFAPRPDPTSNNLSKMSNYSVYAIPAYFFLTLFPHQYKTSKPYPAPPFQRTQKTDRDFRYALYTISTAQKKGFAIYDNRNPRGSWTDNLKATVPADVFATYERAEAAHKNGYESFPLICTAVILGMQFRDSFLFLPVGRKVAQGWKIAC
ncbi:hypothetical protein BP6252_11714 [Coleophoma cylindrospora]|uniref:Uncharacterized protein n=1 Tax=Coleophoma cylindrospora TaxID=1849047 RepID=A0A3D8QKN7_9HELO|nr:hypothetical protein BP6252_11714 [Coleophoma cylindrospora]